MLSKEKDLRLPDIQIPSSLSPEREAMLKHAFLDSAGITDETPYAGMTGEQIIRTIVNSAGIKMNEYFASLGASVSKLAKALENEPTIARALGKKFRPLLDKAAKEGRIDRRSGERNPQWDIKQQADAKRVEAILRADFCSIATIKDDFTNPDSRDFMNSYYKMLRRNIGLSHETIASRFSPPVDRQFIANRLLGIRKYDKDFVAQYAHAIKPYLLKGMKEGWLDEDKNPLPSEQILREQLAVPNGFLEGKRGREAVLLCIEKSGLPAVAISAIVGEENTWVTLNKKTKTSLVKEEAFGDPAESAFLPAHVVRIARAIKPYVHGKQWNGVLEVTDPVFLQAHRQAKEYAIDALKARLPSSMAQEVDSALNGVSALALSLRDTLGPTLRALRSHVNMTQRHFEPELPFNKLSGYESNCFNPRITNAQGELNETIRRRLDKFAEVVAERWQLKDATLSWVAREDARASARKSDDPGRPF